MLTAIYGNKNGTQDSIAWLLCEESNIGPQIYTAPWKNLKPNKRFEYAVLGPLVEDLREGKYADLHITTMRHMENDEPDENGVLNFLQPFRTLESIYSNVVWSNYFGGIKRNYSLISADKVILCNETLLEDTFHYVISHAFKLIDYKRIENHCRLWWQDHVYVDNEDVGQWREIWYNHYHSLMHKLHDQGKLKYMWQLNFAHWDLYHALERGGDPYAIKLVDADDFDRLIEQKLCNDNEKAMHSTLHFHKEAGVDHIVVNDPCWWDQIDEILNYTGIDKSDNLKHNLDAYVEAYTQKREWFNTNFDSYVRKYNGRQRK